MFPSYGIGNDVPAVMIACYNWSQDASRFASLMQGSNTDAEKSLIESIINDIAIMHNVKYDDLMKRYDGAYFTWDWQNDPYTRGAFALFNPGQFYEMFPAMSRPAGGGYLHFAGEATSVYHAWVPGSIASAYKSVLEILSSMEGQKTTDAESTLIKALGTLLRQPEEIDMELAGQQLAYGALPNAWVIHGDGRN